MKSMINKTPVIKVLPNLTHADAHLPPNRITSHWGRYRELKKQGMTIKHFKKENIFRVEDQDRQTMMETTSCYIGQITKIQSKAPHLLNRDSFQMQYQGHYLETDDANASSLSPYWMITC